MPNFVYIPVLLLTLLIHTEAQKTDSVFECSQLNDLSEMSRCFRKRFTENVKKRAAEASQGYPYQVAPLPPYLIADPSPNSISVQPNRIGDTKPQRRIQGYTVPQYRNFLDIDTPFTPRAVEYRPVYDSYSVPVLVYPSVDEGYYMKPVKSQRKNPKKYSLYDEPSGYYADKYSNYKYNREYEYRHTANPKPYDSKYMKEKSNKYNEDYYVPANSPIMGDIRRSLMDYTGSDDLMVDEPEYVIQSQTINAMGNDFYDFRRAYLDDLQVKESRRVKSKVRSS